MSRTETFWKPRRANSRSAAAKTAALVAAWSCPSGGSKAPVSKSLIASRLAGELLHGLLQALERQRVHAIPHQLFDQADGGRVVPVPLGRRIQPDHALEDGRDPVFLDGAGLLVPVLHRAARIGDL